MHCSISSDYYTNLKHCILLCHVSKTVQGDAIKRGNILAQKVDLFSLLNGVIQKKAAFTMATVSCVLE